MYKKIKILIATILILIAISGCSIFNSPPKNSDMDKVNTVAMQTVQAVMTENAFSTQVAMATIITINPTIEDNQPVKDATATEKFTPNVVLATQTPTLILTATPVISDKVSYIKDISIVDGTSFSGNERFTKIWRLKNNGNTTWTSDYDVVFVSGNAMGGKASYPLPGIVKPGETIDISIDLKSPEQDGEYIGNWMLRNSRGVVFGLGSQDDQPFWVKIMVTNYFSEDIPSQKYPFDFTSKLCDAKWESSHGNVRTPCDSSNISTDVYVSVLMKPEFENMYNDDERTIKMHLMGDKGVWMQGFYNAYLVQDGDNFKTIVGCLENNQTCDVVVSLDIKVDGGNVQNIGKWIENYDGKITSIDINLNEFVDKNVEFILGISNRTNTTSDIFWLAPRIVR